MSDIPGCDVDLILQWLLRHPAGGTLDELTCLDIAPSIMVWFTLEQLVRDGVLMLGTPRVRILSDNELALEHRKHHNLFMPPEQEVPMYVLSLTKRVELS